MIQYAGSLVICATTAVVIAIAGIVGARELRKIIENSGG